MAAWILAQFEADGAHRWSHRWQHPAHQPYYIAADAAGGTIVGGYSVPGDDTFPGFLVRHDATGVFQWERVLSTDPNTSDDTNVNVAPSLTVAAMTTTSCWPTATALPRATFAGGSGRNHGRAPASV